MPTVPDIHRRGTRADQATVASPPLTVGTLYFVTDEGVTERWNGSTWDAYSGPGTGAAPTAHAPTHQSGGSDPIALDTLAAPTDVTTLSASASAHGLLRKLSGTATQYLDGSGAWSIPAGSGGTGDVVGPASAVDNQVTRFDGTTGKLVQASNVTIDDAGTLVAAGLGGTPLNASQLTSGTVPSARLPTRVGAVGLIIDGGGSTITTGLKGFLEVPFAGTITAATVLSIDASVTSGSIVIDVWKDTYANYPPTVADTITASAKPTLSSATKSRDATLTGWTTSISAGDILGFKVDSATTVTKVLISLTVQAT